MDTLRREDIRPLLETRDGPCISIYIPTGRAGVETLQNPIRFKNQVREAERRLEEMALRPADVRNMTAPMRALVEDYYFWQHQAAGMAAFRSPDYFGHFRLPVACEERAVVTGRFHLKPLLRIFAWDSRFWVLAVSRNSVRLLDCTRFQAREAPLPEDMPKKLADVVPETDVEPHLQVRSAGQRGAGGRTGAFHQHGGALEEPKEDLARYFREIDRGLRAVLRDERAPLVFAGTDYYFPIYRSVNTYAHLAPEAVPASAEGMRAEELHQRALSGCPAFVRPGGEEGGGGIPGARGGGAGLGRPRRNRGGGPPSPGGRAVRGPGTGAVGPLRSSQQRAGTARPA
jgi:hypothetical protein